MRQLIQEIILDTLVSTENVSVNESELTEYMFRQSQRYGMSPDKFIKEVSDNGQVPALIADVGRAKALASVLSRVKVVTTSGKTVDLEALRPPARATQEDVLPVADALLEEDAVLETTEESETTETN